MKTVMLYVRAQIFPLTLLVVFIIVPMVLVRTYLPSIPYTLYFFLILLFLIKTLVHNDSQFKKKMMPAIQSELSKELKRNPSSKEIYGRSCLRYSLITVTTVL